MGSFIIIMIILSTIMGGSTLFFTIRSLQLIHAEIDMIRDEYQNHLIFRRIFYEFDIIIRYCIYNHWILFHFIRYYFIGQYAIRVADHFFIGYIIAPTNKNL